jgi:hypothetical protein
MKNYNKIVVSLVLAMGVNTALKSEIISVTAESQASGNFFDSANENDTVNGVDAESFDFGNPIDSRNFGSRDQDSAGTFDSLLSLDGDEILFKNGNSSFGFQSSSYSKTVVTVLFQNTTQESFIPELQSLILPAGMGFYLSDCDATDLRACDASGAETLADISPFSGNEGIIGTAGFNFSVELEGVDGSLTVDDQSTPAVVDGLSYSSTAGTSTTENSLLYSLSGNLELGIENDGTTATAVVTPGGLDAAEAALDGFTESTPEGDNSQLTFDWDATLINLTFPAELAPGQVAKLIYTVETSTFVTSDCISTSTNNLCPIAYSAFGDPIGRGGAASRRGSSTPTTDTPSAGTPSTMSAFSIFSPLSANGMSSSTSFAMTDDTPITGHQAGLYRLGLPTFNDGVIGFMANSGPGISANAVSAPATLALVLLGLGFVVVGRKSTLI